MDINEFNAYLIGRGFKPDRVLWLGEAFGILVSLVREPDGRLTLSIRWPFLRGWSVTIPPRGHGRHA